MRSTGTSAAKSMLFMLIALWISQAIANPVKLVCTMENDRMKITQVYEFDANNKVLDGHKTGESWPWENGKTNSHGTESLLINDLFIRITKEFSGESKPMVTEITRTGGEIERTIGDFRLKGKCSHLKQAF